MGWQGDVIERGWVSQYGDIIEARWIGPRDERPRCSIRSHRVPLFVQNGPHIGVVCRDCAPLRPWLGWVPKRHVETKGAAK